MTGSNECGVHCWCAEPSGKSRKRNDGGPESISRGRVKAPINVVGNAIHNSLESDYNHISSLTKGAYMGKKVEATTQTLQKLGGKELGL